AQRDRPGQHVPDPLQKESARASPALPLNARRRAARAARLYIQHVSVETSQASSCVVSILLAPCHTYSLLCIIPIPITQQGAGGVCDGNTSKSAFNRANSLCRIAPELAETGASIRLCVSAAGGAQGGTCVDSRIRVAHPY